ncbi:MAG: aspartate aminotransferase family protein [gamma proteobacterium endosymbiont of Lamellibrachia anaximandri]|nr:aspartate aminotransferase family protein [gamma proteobacterium endosymbiont of Lamellibrachia anaximandri]MBL3533102.1 aspartate aminotransferase family protein [gamma proteobacterium endosymbiont of Lamellibrachia anaximandri]
MSDTLMATYRRLPVTFERGEGAWLWDTAGKRYLDAIAGIAVCGLGHAHPAVKAAICEQAGTLIHTSNLYGIQQQQILGDNLTRLSGLDRVFFANSGAEANEAAIKIARLYGHRKGIDNPAILVMENSFHGRTLATLSATGNRKVQAGFEPLVQGFVRVPFGDFDAIKEVTQSGASVVAVLVEPVQGEGGVNIPPADYLNNIRTLCDEQGWLMMLDEIQTGMGRTGRMFAHQHNGIQPDVMTLAKGLGNGVPIGACLARGMAAEVLGPGSHGSTFGGNPLACRVGNSVIETLESDNLVARAATLSERFLAGFEAVFQPNKGVTDIRASGLLIGIELDRPCTELVSQALNEGLLINVTADKIIRLLPPLILTDQEADQIIETVSTLVDNFLSASQPK